MKNTLDRKKLPAKDIFYFRQRFKNKIFQSALAYFVELAKEKNLTKKDMANLLDKDPAQITRWFAGPNNWTLDTISDLLLAMDAELKYEIVSLHKSSHQTTKIPKIGEHLAQSETVVSDANMNTQFSIPKSELASFCRAQGIQRLSIYGSALREDFDPESDIDVLVEFAPNCSPGLMGIASMEIKLSKIFGGRKVDLRTPEDLSRYFRQDVLDSAEVQYAQG